MVALAHIHAKPEQCWKALVERLLASDGTRDQSIVRREGRERHAARRCKTYAGRFRSRDILL